MIVDLTDAFNDLKSFIERKFEQERMRTIKVKDYVFPEKVFKMPDMEEYLNLSKKVIVKAIEKGELNAFKVDRDWRTTREELDKFLDLQFRKEESKRAGKPALSFFGVKHILKTFHPTPLLVPHLQTCYTYLG